MLQILLTLVVLALVFNSPPTLAAPCAGFTDVDDTSPFCVNVEWMRNRGVTLGCTATLYCPNDFVTRLQMAAFMYRLGFQNAHLQGGNAFGAPAVLGTTDNQPLDIRVHNSRVMRYEPNAISPNVIGGSPANNVTPGVRGATIAGGGVPAGDTDPVFVSEAPNRVTDAYGTVGGGYANRAGDNAGTAVDSPFATVGGGYLNTASGYISTVGGGSGNIASDSTSTVGGGYSNVASGGGGTISGGDSNIASANWTTIGGGENNIAEGYSGTVSGGSGNIARGSFSTVIGGVINTASGFGGTVLGGQNNTASGQFSVAMGTHASADQDYCFVFSGWTYTSGGPPATCLGEVPSVFRLPRARLHAAVFRSC